MVDLDENILVPEETVTDLLPFDRVVTPLRLHLLLLIICLVGLKMFASLFETILALATCERVLRFDDVFKLLAELTLDTDGKFEELDDINTTLGEEDDKVLDEDEKPPLDVFIMVAFLAITLIEGLLVMLEYEPAFGEDDNI